MHRMQANYQTLYKRKMPLKLEENGEKICRTNFVAKIVLKSERRDGISCTDEEPKSNRLKNHTQHERKVQI